MKKIIIFIIVVAVLCSLGVFKFNAGRTKELATKGARSGIQVAKKGVNFVGRELQEVSE